MANINRLIDEAYFSEKSLSKLFSSLETSKIMITTEEIVLNSLVNHFIKNGLTSFSLYSGASQGEVITLSQKDCQDFLQSKAEIIESKILYQLHLHHMNNQKGGMMILPINEQSFLKWDFNKQARASIGNHPYQIKRDVGDLINLAYKFLNKS